MKTSRHQPRIALILALALLVSAVAGCSSGGSAVLEGPEAYSNGIDENGFWKGVTALDHVALQAYEGISIPADVHTVQQEDIDSQVDAILNEYASAKNVTSRAVADGDTVNIDYVGRIDGVEFDGGNTGGQGTEVVIGVTAYIDDFLEQLIGHMPGESFDIEVTFPEDYGKEELNGKDAVFAITINHIVEAVVPEQTDEFVAASLSDAFGWTTIAEMKEGIKTDLRHSAVASYIQEHLLEKATVASVPDDMIEYQENTLIQYYAEYATYYNMELDEFLVAYMEVSGTEELLEQNALQNSEAASFALVIQAIAEEAGISVTDDDVAAYFLEYSGSDDYSEYAASYGMPYLKMMILNQAVLDHLVDSAVLE